MKRTLHALAAAALFALGGALMTSGAAQAADQPEYTDAGVLLGVQTEGDPNAPVRVIEFVSLTCPHCADFQEQIFPKIKRDYIDTGKVLYELREVYFDPYGLRAGLIARCGGPERYFGFIDMYLSNQDKWVKAVEIVPAMKKMALQGGLSPEQVEACFNDQKGGEALVEMYNAYREDDRFTGTPTLLVDGEKVSNPTFDNLKAAIDAKLDE